MSILTRLRASLLGSPLPRPFKIAIIGLDNVGKYTLLRRLSSDGTIQTHPHPETNIAEYITGQSSRLNMAFVETYVGYDEPPVLKYWLASQFCDDSDGVIFMVVDRMTRAEATGWMKRYAQGFLWKRQSGHHSIKVREGIPWLVSGNKKEEKARSYLSIQFIPRKREAIEWFVCLFQLTKLLKFMSWTDNGAR
jgi:GTPase SAR1 family protein